MKKALALLAALIAVIGASCTPEQIRDFQAQPPEVQAQILAGLQARPTPSGDCYEAAARHWPGDQGRVRRIIDRESRNIPAAQNARSSAAGCMQMLNIHAHRFSAVGCSWAQRYDADCNLKAAAHLYRAAGWSPWNV